MSALKAAAAALCLAALAAPAFAQPPKALAPKEAPAAPIIATIDLGKENPALAGFTFTQSVATIQPGTGRAWHSHKGAPEIVRISSGVLTEQRNDGPPKQYGPGSELINNTGVEHMWANLGTEPVVFVNTNVRPPAPAK